MSDYGESKEHEKLREYVDDRILELAKMICETYCNGKHPNELENIAYHLGSARNFGWILGQSYMLRNQYHWSKEDLGYNLADAICGYPDVDLPVDDLVPKK